FATLDFCSSASTRAFVSAICRGDIGGTTVKLRPGIPLFGEAWAAQGAATKAAARTIDPVRMPRSPPRTRPGAQRSAGAIGSAVEDVEPDLGGAGEALA